MTLIFHMGEPIFNTNCEEEKSPSHMSLHRSHKTMHGLPQATSGAPRRSVSVSISTSTKFIKLNTTPTPFVPRDYRQLQHREHGTPPHRSCQSGLQRYQQEGVYTPDDRLASPPRSSPQVRLVLAVGGSGVHCDTHRLRRARGRARRRARGGSVPAAA
jgi:hypothetical protein